MAPNLHSSLCLNEIKQKDAYLTLTTVIGIMDQQRKKSFGGTSQIVEAPHQTPQRNVS